MYCWDCGERVDWEEVICPECGADQSDEGGSDDWDDEYPFVDDEEHY
jgi:RNA polymerase subunit RPABC4/transcription elongation factor Spt4